MTITSEATTMTEGANLADPKTNGLLPSHAIEKLIDAGSIILQQPAVPGQIQPASLDLRLGKSAFRLRASFLPGPNGSVAGKLHDFIMHEIDLRNGAVLETGCVYLVPLLEHLNLTNDLCAAANPKSSTGRLDVFTRVISDGAQAFDQIEAGYEGPLYAEICPQTFSVLVRTGSRLSQIRFRRGNTRDSDQSLLELHEEQNIISSDTPNIADGIALSVDLSGSTNDGLVGYRAKRHTGIVDVDKPNSCDVSEYWDPLYAGNAKRLILDPDEFYILASKEAVHVPPTHAAEMIPFNPLVGEFRVHYAGFFDPGFGHTAAGGAGSKAVLEVRSHKVPFMLEDGQIIGRLVYERLTETPNELYGEGIGSNYQAQGLKLSKHFRQR